MWFKKIFSFELEQDDVKELVNEVAEKAEEFSFTEDEVGNLTKNIGWTKFSEESDEYAVFGGGYAYFKLMVATKKVPKDKLNRRLNDRIREETGGDPENELSKAEIKELKQAIEESLLLEEEPKYKEVVACVDIEGKRIDVNAGTKDAEEIVSFMRSTIGGSGIKAIPYLSRLSMNTIKQWLVDNPPETILMGGDYELNLDGTKVSYKKVYPRDKNLIEQVEEGYEIEKASFQVLNKVSLAVNAKGEMASCKMEEVAEEELENELMSVSDEHRDAVFEFSAKLRSEIVREFRAQAIGE